MPRKGTKVRILLERPVSAFIVHDPKAEGGNRVGTQDGGLEAVVTATDGDLIDCKIEHDGAGRDGAVGYAPATKVPRNGGKADKAATAYHRAREKYLAAGGRTAPRTKQVVALHKAALEAKKANAPFVAAGVNQHHTWEPIK